MVYDSVMSQPMPPSFSSGGPKKKGPLFWILIVVAVVVVLGMAVVGLGGYFIYRAASNAGVSPQLFKTNPALATAKLAVAMNPDLEEVSIDEATGSIKVRSKSSGKVVTMRIDPNTKRMTSIAEDGSEVQIGNLGDASLPDWLPAYPGTTPQGTLSSKTDKGTSLTFNFRTSDSNKKVLDFYAAQVTKAGLEVTSNSITPGAGMLLAEDRAKGRQVVVTVSATGDVVMSVAEGK